MGRQSRTSRLGSRRPPATTPDMWRGCRPAPRPHPAAHQCEPERGRSTPRQSYTQDSTDVTVGRSNRPPTVTIDKTQERRHALEGHKEPVASLWEHKLSRKSALQVAVPHQCEKRLVGRSGAGAVLLLQDRLKLVWPAGLELFD